MSNRPSLWQIFFKEVCACVREYFEPLFCLFRWVRRPRR
jgi:hypothetical protein